MMTRRRWKLLLGLLVVAPLVLLLHVCDRMEDGEWWYLVWFDNQRVAHLLVLLHVCGRIMKMMMVVCCMV